MTKDKVSKALDYVKSVRLPERSEAEGVDTLEKVGDFDFDKNKNQALVVGSGIISFVRGVTPERRNDIVNSALLAQLVANKEVDDENDIIAWYKAYFKTLTSIGWVIQEKEFVKHKEQSVNLEAHEAIIALATTLLGPNLSALKVVKATLDALKAASSNSPFITLFSRESQHAKTARFQVTLTEEGADGQFLVSLMAFSLSAKAKVTQVLFFKFKKNDVTLRHASGKVTINTDVLTSIREPLRKKLIDFTQEFVKKLPDLHV